MRPRLRPLRIGVLFAAVLLAAALFFPTPYSLILPGRAVDLGNVVRIRHARPPDHHLYLTDVRFAPRVPAIALLAALGPGVSVVWTKDYLPAGMTAVEYDGVEREAMSESQAVAAFVAERAAGLPLGLPRSYLMAVFFPPRSRADGPLHRLDFLLSIDGHPIASAADIHAALAGVKPGAKVLVRVARQGGITQVRVPTTALHGRALLGAYLTTIVPRPHLPVAISYRLPGVSGSSGGLMFALEIYARLHGLPAAARGRRIAGTGTIGYDGSVGPIEGVRQKVIAAREAGSAVFLVPAQNYAAVARTPGIRVIPVSSFRQALQALST